MPPALAHPRFRNALATAAALAAMLATSAAAADDVLAASSVHTRHPGGWYDRLHRFPRTLREFSERTLYGFSVREDQGDVVRDHRVLRLKSPFAYLWLSDLAHGAALSETSNTILFLFPRDPRPEPFLYRLEEHAEGKLRLVGPGGASLVFDAVSHRRLDAAGFRVREPSRDAPAPPDVTPLGLHLRLESVGRSPFLRGATARIVDGDGRACALATDELFAFGDAEDSDLLRFERDVELFAFLRTRCPELRLPPLGAALIAAQDELVRRGREESARAAIVPSPTPPAPRASPRPRAPSRDRDPGPSPDDGGLFEFLLGGGRG